MQITDGGQLNITTEQVTQKQKMITQADQVAKVVAMEQAKKGEIRLEMNFTPVLAHRYL